MVAFLFLFGLLLQAIGLLGLAGVFDHGVFSKQMRAEVNALRTELAELKSRVIFIEARVASMDSMQSVERRYGS